MTNIRIAWLLTSAFYYWQPTMSSLTQRFPQTKVFTSRWHGYAPGLENSFQVEQVGERKIIALTKSEKSYGNNFTVLPLGIVKRLLAFKPDIVFSNAFGVWTMLALLLKPLGRWRVVIAYEGSSPGVDYRNSPPRLAIRRAMVKAANACISNSQAGGQYLKEYLYCPPEKVFVHPYEVPASSTFWESSPILQEKIGNRVQRTEEDIITLVPIPTPKDKVSSSLESPGPIFLFVGGIIPRKGLKYLLDACCHLQAAGKRNYTLWVVGEGSQKAELEQFCQEQGLGDRVRWWGRVEYGDLGQYFSQADVFILPTLEDTWGMVVLEALVLGKPVLCSIKAGASELIIEGKNGYCFDPYHPEYLTTILERFLDQPELAQQMGQAAKTEMEEHYTPEAAAQFLCEVTFYVNQDKR